MALVKSAELERLTDLRRDVRLFLIAGPDITSAEAVASHLITLAGKNAERTTLTADMLGDDPNRLASEAASMSLFSSTRIIRLAIAGAGDECLTAIKTLLEGKHAENPIIAIAPALTKKSRLAKLVTASPRAQFAICYQPTRDDLIGIAVTAARMHQLWLGRSEAGMMVDLIASDRALLIREIEKIAIYLDAGPERSCTVSPDDIVALGAAIHEEDVSACVNVALSGDYQQLPSTLNKVEALGIAEIRIIRVLANRAALLARLRAEVEKGQHPQTIVGNRKYGIFWKERAAITVQLRLWDSVRIVRLFSQLLSCEQKLKAPGTVGALVFRKLMVDITRRAAQMQKSNFTRKD